MKLAILLLFSSNFQTLAWSSGPAVGRRKVVEATLAGIFVVGQSCSEPCSADDTATAANSNNYVAYESRSRGSSQKYAVIREDYWYMMGRTPPRLLNGPLKSDDPQWNAFGTCETTEGGSGTNSCTYVSLKQRIPIYSKYGFNIRLGAKEYSALGKALRAQDWKSAEFYVNALPSASPPPVVDALLKMVLFASGMLTSPNYSGPSRELLVARFYVNELAFAVKEVKEAIDAQDSNRALSAWDFGKDSFNSYFQVVNGRISAKVGEVFEPIS